MHSTSVILPCSACGRTGISGAALSSCFICDGLGYEECFYSPTGYQNMMTKPHKKSGDEPVMKTNLLENANENGENAERN